MSRLRLKTLVMSASDAAAPLSVDPLWVRKVWIKSGLASDACYIGDSDVTNANGFLLRGSAGAGTDGVADSIEIGSEEFNNNKLWQINLQDIYAVCAATEEADLHVAYLEIALGADE